MDVVVEKTVEVYESVEVVENEGSRVLVGEWLMLIVPRAEREPLEDIVLLFEEL